MLGHISSPHGLPTDRDVVGQIRIAFAHPLPLVIGALLGALVPIATYTVGHAELGEAGWCSLSGAIVVGGLGFSAITVYKWGRRAFGGAVKAVGFVVLSEGVMSFSHSTWLSLVVLGFLVAINAVANGATLAVVHMDAEARRAATAQVTTPAPALVLDSAAEDRLDRLEAELTRVAAAMIPAPVVAQPVTLPEASGMAAVTVAASDTPEANLLVRRRPRAKGARVAKIAKTTKPSRTRRAADVVN